MDKRFDARPAERKATTPDETALIRRVAERIVLMGLSAPAARFLERGEPLSLMGDRAAVFFAPFATAFSRPDGFDRVAELLEDRTNVDSLLREIEKLEDEGDHRVRSERRKAPQRRFGRIVRRFHMAKPAGPETKGRKSGARNEREGN